MIGLIPRPFIDELLNRTDLVEFVDGYVPLKKQGNSHVACCPFHTEKTPSFNVIAKKQFYHCFGCGVSGNAISFAMNYLHQSFSEAVETLATRLGLQVPREGRTEKNQQMLNLYQFLEKIAHFYQQTLKNNGQSAIHYLKQRQVSGEIAKHYQLGFSPPGWQTLETEFRKDKQALIATGMLISKEDGKTYDRYRNRIMFPIHDRHGRIIGFGGRAIESTQKPKYLNSPETAIFQKSRELYGLHQVLKQQNPVSNILIVEGYLDVIALSQHGICNAVATLGTATSTYHIQLLTKYTKQIIFCFDGDNAGRQAAWRALENSLPHLNSGLDASFIFLPEGHDPDSLVREEGKTQFLNRIKKAMPLNQFFVDTLMLDIDSSNLAGRSQLIHAAKPHLLKIPDGPYKQLLTNEIARLTRIEPHRVSQLILDTTENATPTVSNKNIARSPIRIAIAILLQHPEIVAGCLTQFNPSLLIEKKQKILRALMKQVSESPAINTAKLVEAWRDTPLFNALAKLAVWEHHVPENGLAREFVDIILFLAKQNRERAIDKLMKKAQNQGLTESERLQLQEMHKERHRDKNDKRNIE